MSPAAGTPERGSALRAGRAEEPSGPAYGGAEGLSARVSAQPHSRKRLLRIAFGDGLAADLDREPRGLRAPDGGVAGQAPPPGGRADWPTTSVSSEASVITSEMRSGPVESVDPDALTCPACGEPVTGEPPLGWLSEAGAAPEFSHRDGSVLCPDSAGRIGEPVEAGGVRFALTDEGARALDADAGAIASWAGVWS